MSRRLRSRCDHPDAYEPLFWYWREPSIGSYINRSCSDHLSISGSGSRLHLKFLLRLLTAESKRFPSESDVGRDCCSVPHRQRGKPPAQERSLRISTWS